MTGNIVLDGVGGVASEASGVFLAALASWEVAAVAFGFVFAVLVVGFLLERWGVGLHA